MKNKALLIVFLSLLTIGTAFAAIPQRINFQGVLRLNNQPVKTTTSVKFAIFDVASGGTALWNSGEDTILVTPDESGYFNVALGDTGQTALGLSFDKAYWVEVSIGANTLIPRQPLNSVPYAFTAQSLPGVTVKDGNVGIGTTTPLFKLHSVAPGGFFKLESDEGISTSGSVPIVAQSNSTFFGALNKEGRETFAINNDGNKGTSSQRGVITFYDKYDGKWNPSISLKTGNVGIGTAEPTATLEVKGNIKATGAQNNYFAGNVGIGTTDPGGYKLSVAGALSVGNILSQNVGMGISPPITGTDRLWVQGTARISANIPQLKLLETDVSPNKTWIIGGEGNEFFISADNTGPNSKLLKLSGSSSAANIYFPGLLITNPASGYPLYMESSTGRIYYQISSRRYKHDIINYEFETKKINELKPVRFKWNEDTGSPNKEDIGLIAEDVYAVFPELVTLNINGQPESVDYSKLSIVLLKTVKELKAENDSLKVRVEALEGGDK